MTSGIKFPRQRKGNPNACREADLVREKLPHVSTTELTYGEIFATEITSLDRESIRFKIENWDREGVVFATSME